MFRRFVALLLLPSLVLVQSRVVFAHTHPEGQPADHALHPHFHVHGNHDHHGNDGDHAGCHRHDPMADHESDTGFGSPVRSDHDSDAIYVDSNDISVGARATQIDVLTRSLIIAVPELSCTSASEGSQSQPSLGAAHPPPLRGYGSPLYIWQLALLI